MKLPKNADHWLPAYVQERAQSLVRRRPRPKRLWVAITDHYEPMGQRVSLETGKKRVAEWQERWPRIAASAPADANGLPPRYTFFYPQEEYQRELLNSLAELSRSGTTDVEVHIHHDQDTPAGFQEKMRDFCARLNQDHGLLRFHNGRLAFGFIHGNWALDNSHPDGRWCGVTGELQLLRDLGCYADFTMPSLPFRMQSKILNKIYWTTGDPLQPRGFDQGVEATVGGGVRGDLLMIAGPGGLGYQGRLVPSLETGELAASHPVTAYRVKRWLDLAPRIGEDIFIKLFGHGAREDNATALLGNGGGEGDLALVFRLLHEAAQERGLELHWASAFEMFRAVDALIQPRAGTPETRPS